VETNVWCFSFQEEIHREAKSHVSHHLTSKQLEFLYFSNFIYL